MFVILLKLIKSYTTILKLKPEDVASMYDDILIAKLNPGQVNSNN